MVNGQGPYADRVAHVRELAAALAHARTGQADLAREMEARLDQLFEEAERIFATSPRDAVSGAPLLEILVATKEAPRSLRIGPDIRLFFDVDNEGNLCATSDDSRLMLPSSAGPQAPGDLARILPTGSADGTQCTLVFETGKDTTGTIQFVDLVAQLLGQQIAPTEKSLRSAQRRARG